MFLSKNIINRCVKNKYIYAIYKIVIYLYIKNQLTVSKTNMFSGFCSLLLYRKEDFASTSTDEPGISERTRQTTSTSQQTATNVGGTFTCSFCPLREHYDYKGTKPPFARQFVYSEECYIMKDPFSLPSRGEVLVLGADCSVCEHAVCLSCSIFYTKRFCPKCALSNMQYLPSQLHGKIRNLMNQADS